MTFGIEGKWFVTLTACYRPSNLGKLPAEPHNYFNFIYGPDIGVEVGRKPMLLAALFMIPKVPRF